MTLRELITKILHEKSDDTLMDYEIQINNVSAVFPKNIVEHVHGVSVGMEFLGSSIYSDQRKIIIELEMKK